MTRCILITLVVALTTGLHCETEKETPSDGHVYQLDQGQDDDSDAADSTVGEDTLQRDPAEETAGDGSQLDSLPDSAPLDTVHDSQTPTDSASDPDSTQTCRGSAGTAFETLQVSGTTRNYAVHAPSSYDGCSPTPLLIFFHGTDTSNVDNPEQNQRMYMQFTGLNQTADVNGFIVAYPTARALSGPMGTALAWALPFQGDVDGDDRFTMALLDTLQSTYNVDATRISIAGFSQGGFYVSHLFPNHSNRFSAFAMYGAVCSSTWECPGQPPHRVPGFVRIGANDEVVSTADAHAFHRSLLSNGWEDGATLDFQILEGRGHTYFSDLNGEMWGFFSRFSL